MKPSEYLRQYMKQRGITQMQIAEKLGVGQTNVSQWYTGKRPIPPERALEMEYHFGIDAEKLDPRVAEYKRLVLAIATKEAA